MKKSIGDNMIPKGWSFERGLELVKKSGWDGIELWLGDVPWFQMETTDAQVTELRRKVENAGLSCRTFRPGCIGRRRCRRAIRRCAQRRSRLWSAKSRRRSCSDATQFW